MRRFTLPAALSAALAILCLCLSLAAMSARAAADVGPRDARDVNNPQATVRVGNPDSIPGSIGGATAATYGLAYAGQAAILQATGTVSEPATLALLGIGLVALAGIGAWRRRSTRSRRRNP